MQHKELGATGVMVPEVGMGVWRYSGGPEPLRHGIKLGATLIDTAEAYGTEGVVGEAIAGIRADVFVATKVSGNHLRHDDVLRAADASLARLKIDCIDLYQVHWPNSAVPIRETMAAMGSLVDRGLIRHIGVSNFSATELREAQLTLSNHRITCNQVLYNLNRREIEEDLVPWCEENRVTIMAYTPLDSGRLARRSEYPPNPKGQQVLEEIKARTGRTFAQVALNWCLSHPNLIVIPKSNSIDRIIENCGASDWRLSNDDFALLNDAFRRDDDDDWN